MERSRDWSEFAQANVQGNTQAHTEAHAEAHAETSNSKDKMHVESRVSRRSMHPALTVL